MTAEPRICEHCGAKIVEYRHGLTVPLLQALVRLAEAGGGPLNLRELNLGRTQWDNFQKLRYWGLVMQRGRKTGVWQITPFGWQFLRGRLRIPRRVWTFRGEWVRDEGELVTADQVDGTYQCRAEWWDNSQLRLLPVN